MFRFPPAACGARNRRELLSDVATGIRAQVNQGQLSFLWGSVLILLVFWAARHMLQGSFGFYEDDYTLVVRSMASSWGDTRLFIQQRFAETGGQGRPLQHSLVFVLGRLSGDLGGRAPAYWLAFVLVGTNALLYFALLRKAAGPSFALLGGLTYALYSADTTQAFLYHAFGLQPAMTFLMLASLSYISGRRLLGYLLILGALFTYESTYLVFLAVPLLQPDWDREWLRRSIRHTAVLLAALLAVAFARLAAGEGRVLGLGWPQLAAIPISHSLAGPLVAIGSYLLRPAQAIQALNLPIAIASLAGFFAFSAALNWLSLPYRAPIGDWSLKALVRIRAGLSGESGQSDTDELMPARLIQLVVAGAAMLVLAYPLTFTIRPYAISGRDTRVHLAAAMGAALFWTAIWCSILTSVRRRWARRTLVATLAGLMALCLGFGVLVQEDYARAWRLQQKFWSSVVDQLPSVDEGIRVLVDPRGLFDTRYIDANTWNLPLVLQYVYSFPEGWTPPPRVYRLVPDWRNRSLYNPKELKAVDYTFNYVVAPWDKVVLLTTSDGRVSGRLEGVELGGKRFTLEAQPTGVGPNSEPGYLFGQLVGTSN